MTGKPNWGWEVAGALFIVVGVGFLWSGRSGLLYHTPIYFKGPSWVDPWQSIIGGALLCALGLFLIANALRKKSENDRHDS